MRSSSQPPRHGTKLWFRVCTCAQAEPTGTTREFTLSCWTVRCSLFLFQLFLLNRAYRLALSDYVVHVGALRRLLRAPLVQGHPALAPGSDPITAYASIDHTPALPRSIARGCDALCRLTGMWRLTTSTLWNRCERPHRWIPVSLPNTCSDRCACACGRCWGVSLNHGACTQRAD